MYDMTTPIKKIVNGTSREIMYYKTLYLLETRYIFILFFPIQTNVEVVSKILRWVIESQLLIQPINLLHILILQLKVALQIILDARRRLALRHHTPTMGNTPGKGNLRAALPILLANLHQDRVLL